MPADVEEFRASSTASEPPQGASAPLQALWWSAKGEWDRAHLIVGEHQGIPACDLVHAHLHRQEGNLEGAASWYADAGETPSPLSIEAEWEALVGRFLPAR